ILFRAETKRSLPRQASPSGVGKPETRIWAPPPAPPTTSIAPPTVTRYNRPSGPKAMAVTAPTPRAYRYAVKPAGTPIAARGRLGGGGSGVGVGGGVGEGVGVAVADGEGVGPCLAVG